MLKICAYFHFTINYTLKALDNLKNLLLFTFSLEKKITTFFLQISFLRYEFVKKSKNKLI